MFSNSFLDVRDQPELMKRRKDKVNFRSNNKNKKVFIIGFVIAAIAISGILAIVLPSVVIHNVNNNNDHYSLKKFQILHIHLLLLLVIVKLR